MHSKKKEILASDINVLLSHHKILSSLLSCPFQRVEQETHPKRECEEKIVHVDIDIPDILKKKLEDDCFYINKRKKVHTAKNTAIVNIVYMHEKRKVAYLLVSF